MSLTLRGIKGSALTHAELDNNFLWLGNRGTSNLTLNGDVLTITRGDDSYYTISLSGVGTTVTGLSYTGNTLTLFQSDGSSESVVIAADSFVTGFTYNNANRLTISQNQGKQDINVFINQMSGLTINGTLNTNQIVLSGTNLTNILDNTVKKYSQTLTSPTAGRYTITHNLGTTDISVSLWLAFSNELTNAKILNRLPNSVDVEFSVAPGEDVLVLIMGTTVNSSGVAYIYSAVTVGPNQIVYGDATGLITSNSTFVRNPISGNIGVGVTSPSAKLHINNTGTDNTVLFEDNTNPDSTPFVIDNNGNVGIGTSTPTYKLDVSGTVRTTGIAAINNPPFSSPQFALEVKAIDNSIGGLRLWSNNETASVSMAYRGISSSSLFDIQTNSGQPLTLNASGNNVGIGTSTPDSKLVIKGSDSSSSNYGLKVQNSGGTDNFVVRNDGMVNIGNSTSTVDSILNVTSNNPSSTSVTVRNDYISRLSLSNVSDTEVTLQLWGFHGVGGVIKSKKALIFNNYTNNSGYLKVFNIDTNPVWLFGNQLGSYSPESNTRIRVMGQDSSSSGYGLIVQDSGGTNNFVVRNDATIIIGNPNEYAGSSIYFDRPNRKIYINGNADNGINGNDIDICSRFTRWGSNDGTGFGVITEFSSLHVHDNFSSFKINKHAYDSHDSYTSLGVAWREGSGGMPTSSIGSFIYNRNINLDDIYNRTLNGIKIDTSLGSWTNTTGTSTNIGLNVTVGNADVNYAAVFNGGNVGIGTSTPTEKLHVSGNTKITGGLNIGVIGSGSPLINLGLDSSGNVVTGTTGGGGGIFTGGTISGPTNFTNGLTANTLTVGTFSVGRKFSSSESFTGSVTKTVTHNLNTQDVIVQLWDSSNNLLNGATIVANNVNSVDITVSSTATYKVVIIG